MSQAGDGELADGAGVGRQGGGAAIQALHKRYTELAAQAAEHEQLLAGSIDDAQATMRLVQMQLASLLARAS